MDPTADFTAGQAHQAGPAESCKAPSDLKTRIVDGLMRWLFGQEAIVVVLVLILVAVSAGLVYLYRDQRADTRNAYTKEAEARKEFRELDEKNRAHDAAQTEKLSQAMTEANREFARSVGQSLDRLADEIRRDHNR